MAEWHPYGRQLDMPSNKVNVLGVEEISHSRKKETYLEYNDFNLFI